MFNAKEETHAIIESHYKTRALEDLNKIKVLFVGSFVTKTKDSSTGGQTFASLSLTNSVLSNNIVWIKIDTTASTARKRLFFARAANGFIRLLKYIFKIIVHQPNYILLFAAHGWSFKEKALMASIGKSFGKKVIFAPRSGIVENDVVENPKFKNTIYTALKNSEYLICQSNAWKVFYNKYREDSNYKPIVINNWLDAEKYVKLPIKDSRPKNILFLGLITPNKGIFDLVKAFAPICKEHDLTLSIAGNGESYDQLEKEIKTRELTNSTNLLGWIHGKNKEEQLSKADILVLPSYKEGYPNSLLEAMASGVPTIATNVGSIPEIIDHKNNGYLIEPGNIADLQKGILWYLDNPKKRIEIAHNARTTILEKNSINNAVTQFEKIFLS